MKKLRLIFAGLNFLAFIYGFSCPLYAQNLSFKGTVLEPPPCIFNGGVPVTVDFGNQVMTTRVDGVNYTKDVNYNLVCTSPPKNTLRMQINGLATSFNTGALNTDRAGLGITFKADGKGFPVNQWLNFINPARPLIKAVPVKDPDIKLTAGAFVATATLMIDYQ